MDLYFFLIISFSVLVILVSRFIYVAYGKRRQLHWMPEVPGIPILGNALQVQKSTGE